MLRTILRSRTATFGALLVFLIVGVTVLAPLIAPASPTEQRIAYRNRPPGAQNLLGTDALGRDILSRLIWGARLSLALGFFSVLVGSTIGVSVGLVSGYYGGWVDQILMRVVDLFLAFPLYLMAIVVVAVLGNSFWTTTLAVGFSLFASFARVARGETLAVRHRDYVVAAQAQGARDLTILARHILPNIQAPLVVLGTLRVGSAILVESSLSFLGLGLPPPQPAWGLMVSEGLRSLRDAPWVPILPGLCIAITVLALNLFGDGLRDALDPRLRRSAS